MVLLVLGLLGTVPAHASIIYTCDANIDAAVAGTCNFLNTTVAGLYDSTFNDVNARVYIHYGSTGLGGSLTALDGFSYTTFRNALNADRTSAADTTFFNSDVPVASPFGTENIAMTHANARALGLAAGSNGVTPAGGGCSGINGTTCFDSIITISDAVRVSNGLWYRTLSGGAQGGSQYDFFTVVFHESDEVLDTISLCCGQITGFYSPTDLGRYSSPGLRTHGFGGNAFFSIDGGTTNIVQYNNLNNGADTGDFATNCTYVQDAFGCLGGPTNHNPLDGVELTMLDVIGYTRVVPITAAPEADAIALLGIGLGSLAFIRRKFAARRGA
jgi:hypothetical protein